MVKRYPFVMSTILTLLATGLFVAGVRSLVTLKRTEEATRTERSDPFFTSVALLFSTANRSDEFCAVQRRAVWLFCAAIFLLYIARVAIVQSAAS